jgi:hypothetical protein
MVSRLHAWLLAAGSLVGCSDEPAPLTQLVLVADSDLPELDRVVFEVSSQELGSKTAAAPRSGAFLPSYLAVVHEHGPLGPVTVSARGLKNGSVLLSRTQQVDFVSDETRVVTLHLLSSCLGVTCAAEQTCVEARCVAQRLDESALPAWSGRPPSAQAGTSVDAGTGGPDASALDGGPRTPDDARVGDAAVHLMQCSPPPAPLVDLNSDPGHCGSCTKVCKPAENCVTGACAKK